MIYTVTIEHVRPNKLAPPKRRFETTDLLAAVAALVDASRQHEKAHKVTIEAKP